MRTSLLPLELARWDVVPAGRLLAVSCWTDVRPLRGAAGLLDWRLDGHLSSLLGGGQLHGDRGEKLLLPLRDLPWTRALIVGLGAASSFDEEVFRHAVTTILTTHRGLGGGGLALALPGRDLERVGVERSLELFLEIAAGEDLTNDTVVLIDALPALKTLSTGLRLHTPPPGTLAPVGAVGSAPHKHGAPILLPSRSDSG